MNTKIKNILKVVLGAGLVLSQASCSDYLERDADTTVSETEGFKDFPNFQGYVEKLYQLVPNKISCNWSPSWNWGDDELFNVNGFGNDQMTTYIDHGDFRQWLNNRCFLKRPNEYGPRNGGLWDNAFKAIRICNVGLDNIEKIKKGEISFNGTDEQLDFIKGQMIFFRAWYHFSLATYFGGMPISTKAFGPDDVINEPRKSYGEVLDFCIEEFGAAADLLPMDWDLTSSGKPTRGYNDLRINKTMALAYKGKAALWKASPLAVQLAANGNLVHADTYNYNVEAALVAAETLGSIINSVESGESQYKLVQIKGTEDLYNHTNGADLMDYSQLFYTLSNDVYPGSTEAIFRNIRPDLDNNSSIWQMAHVWTPNFPGLSQGDAKIHLATANYVHYAYGMANGLPLDDPKSGFDATHPWKNRDLRFYHDIIFDGCKLVNTNTTNPYKYMDLQTNGTARDAEKGSRTGYLVQKLVPHDINEIDKKYSNGFVSNLTYLRLADVYMMYAEAVVAAKNDPSARVGCTRSALEAMNDLRLSRGAGQVGGQVSPEDPTPLNTVYQTDPKKFMDEVRRERACELSFEGFRFEDLQRWLLLTEKQSLYGNEGRYYEGSSEYDYTTKYSVEFIRTKQDIAAEYKANKKYDPADAEVSGYKMVPIITRKFDAKHYLFPLPTTQTYYDDFEQNPGW